MCHISVKLSLFDSSEKLRVLWFSSRYHCILEIRNVKWYHPKLGSAFIMPPIPFRNCCYAEIWVKDEGWVWCCPRNSLPYTLNIYCLISFCSAVHTGWKMQGQVQVVRLVCITGDISKVLVFRKYFST
jgi:hypothetical protein